MRRAARVDDNHGDIVDALRSIGAKVQSLAFVGGGCPDLLVAFRGTWYLIEVKDGEKAPSRQQLTECEQRWWDTFADIAPVHICRTVDEALEVVGAV